MQTKVPRETIRFAQLATVASPMGERQRERSPAKRWPRPEKIAGVVTPA
jgi:hypothetical protein